MARLTTEQWQQAKADYEIGGLSQRQVAEKYKVSNSTVSERAKKECWEVDKTEHLKDRKANAIIELAKTELQTEHLNRTERTALDGYVADEVEFRLQNDKDMEAVRDKAMQLLDGVDRVSDVKGIMDTLRIQREARLGKAPDTAIQINNNEQTPTQITRVIIEPD